MPFFRRKQGADKQKATSPVLRDSASVKRTPSTRSNPQSPDSVNGDIGVPSSLLNPPSTGNPSALLLSDEALSSVESDPDQTSPKSPMKTSSRLSKTLQEILHDKDAVHCFIQFMESQHADRFIRFWLDANSFRASTLTRMRSHSLQSVGSSSLLMRRTEMRSGDGVEKADPQSDGRERVDVLSLAESQGEENKVAETGQNVPGGVSFSLQRTETGVDELQPNCDIEHASANSGGASEPGACMGNSPTGSALDQHEGTGSGSKEGKPSSLSLAPAPVTVLVTPDSDTGTSPHPDTESLSSETNLHHLSLQDSGIAFPSDGEFAITPSSQSELPSDNESVDTLTDDDTGAVLKGRKSDVGGVSSLQEAVSEKGGSVKGTGSECIEVNRANGVKSKTDSQGPESKDEVSGKSNRSLSMEEMKEKLKKSIERDAVNIFTKYIAKDAPQPIGVDDTLRGDTISKICGEDKQVDPECFVACQEFAVQRMEQEHHRPFMDSEFHCKHQVNVLTGGQVYLADILYNEHALCYFMEFMEQEGAQHLMQFWMAADNFQQQLIQQKGGYDGMQAQNDAMVLYDRFFSLQATTPLGFDDKIRFEVEGNICRESGPLPDCFSKPRDIVLHTLEKVYFPRYMSSDIYYRYLSDLVNTVQMAQDLPVRKHRRQASDASSEHSAGSHSLGTENISTRNTLLAAGSRSTRKVTSPSSSSLASIAGKLEDQLSTMDTDFLNPEDLWKRPNKGSLRLGTVNSLGQFVSEFDPDPDGNKKRSGFFKKRRGKDKDQEEMAVQVAQKILNDVAHMTQIGDACAGTSDRDNQSNNSSNSSSLATKTAPSSLSLPSPFSSTSFFEPPPS